MEKTNVINIYKLPVTSGVLECLALWEGGGGGGGGLLKYYVVSCNAYYFELLQ